MSLLPQTASKRVVNAKATAYASRVHKRGSEPVEKVSLFLSDGRWPGVGSLLRLRSGRCMHQHWCYFINTGSSCQGRAAPVCLQQMG